MFTSAIPINGKVSKKMEGGSVGSADEGGGEESIGGKAEDHSCIERVKKRKINEKKVVKKRQINDKVSFN